MSISALPGGTACRAIVGMAFQFADRVRAPALPMLYASYLASPYEFKPGQRASTPGERQVLDLRRVGIPDVPLLGRYEYRSVGPGLPTHRHPGIVEICYLSRGRQTYRAGGREYHLAGGDVFVTAPGEPHDTAGQPEDCSVLYWINLLIPRRGGSLLTLPAHDSAVLIQKLLHLRERQFAGSPALKSILDQVFTLYARPDDPLRRAAIVNHMVRYLLEILDCAEGCSRARLSPAVLAIVEALHSHPEREYPLAGLAREAGLSLSRFKVRFRMEVGIGPREYILREKVEAARRMLEDDVPVTDVAMRLGFSSSQYFATVFKRFTRQTPREFRAAGATVQLRPV